MFDQNYVITESFDAREIYHFYSKDKFLFIANHNQSRYSCSMLLKGDMKASPGFAIDVHFPGPNFKSEDEICREKSSEHLKHLIDGCSGNMTLRMLTAEERNQISAYKKEENGKLNLLSLLFSICLPFLPGDIQVANCSVSNSV